MSSECVNRLNNMLWHGSERTIPFSLRKLIRGGGKGDTVHFSYNNMCVETYRCDSTM